MSAFLIDKLNKLPIEKKVEIFFSMDSAQLDATEELIDLELKIKAELSLKEFIKQAWKYAEPKEYVQGRHIDLICEHLEGVTKGELNRLIINIPPRHMKSLSCCVHWPAWIWAQPLDSEYPLAGPKTKFLFTSYAETLSIRDSIKCRRILDSDWYQKNWGENFQLTGDQNTKKRFDNTKHGYRLSTSIDGTGTGEGGDIIVVDDPHNIKEVESDKSREDVATYFDEVLQTRVNDPQSNAFVIIMQRSHENDLTGHILSKEHGYVHICLPAEFEKDHPFLYTGDFRKKDGQLLWPERFTKKRIDELSGTMGEYAAAGQLQQRPTPREGGLFKRDSFEIVNAVPAGCVSVRAWDLAATKKLKKNDPAYTCGVRMSKSTDGFFYVENVFRERENANKVMKSIKAIASQDGLNCSIRLPKDPGQAGKAQAQYMISKLAGFVVSAKPETGDKVSRAVPFANQVEAGNVKLVKGDWNTSYIEELEHFPKGRFKDQVDASSSAFQALSEDNLDLGFSLNNDELTRKSTYGVN